jgi:hypothetical protein
VAVERGLQDSGLESEGGGRILIGTEIVEVEIKVIGRKEMGEYVLELRFSFLFFLT